MRYCPHCHRWNLGWPPLCYYCAHSWQVRLCPRGHENPYDAQYCGTCGSADLTDSAGPMPWWIRLIKVTFRCLLLFFLFSFVYGVINSLSLSQFSTLFISLCFLFLAYSLAISILSNTLKKVFLSVNKAINSVLSKIILGIWKIFKGVF